MRQAAVIRPYEPRDQAGVEWLYSRTPPWGRTYPRPEPLPDALQQPLRHYDQVFVAVEQDRAGEAVVGLATMERAEANTGVPLPAFLDLHRPTARLHSVLVAPERWRQGIGTRLVRAAADWSKSSGFEAVILDTTTEQEAAVALYKSIGFRELGQTTFRDWQIIWFELVLQRYSTVR